MSLIRLSCGASALLLAWEMRMVDESCGSASMRGVGHQTKGLLVADGAQRSRSSVGSEVEEEGRSAR